MLSVTDPRLLPLNVLVSVLLALRTTRFRDSSGLPVPSIDSDELQMSILPYKPSKGPPTPARRLARSPLSAVVTRLVNTSPGGVLSEDPSFGTGET